MKELVFPFQSEAHGPWRSGGIPAPAATPGRHCHAFLSVPPANGFAFSASSRNRSRTAPFTLPAGDRVICLSGSPKSGILDSLIVMDVGREFEVFSSRGLEITDRMGCPHVFERLLTVALELAEEGKEGKPLRTIFVLGDHERVMQLSSQMILNPFAGVPEDERNILNPKLKETIREFATIDGAFVIREDRLVLAGGRHLKSSAEGSELPPGAWRKTSCRLEHHRTDRCTCRRHL